MAFNKHEKAEAQLRASLEKFSSSQQKPRLYHDSSSFTTRSYERTPSSCIDTSDFNTIIAVDSTEMTATVGCNVTMAALLDATLKSGVMPKIVPETPNITVGGAFVGLAGLSAAFKSGVFHDKEARNRSASDLMLLCSQVREY